MLMNVSQAQDKKWFRIWADVEGELRSTLLRLDDASASAIRLFVQWCDQMCDQYSSKLRNSSSMTFTSGSTLSITAASQLSATLRGDFQEMLSVAEKKRSLVHYIVLQAFNLALKLGTAKADGYSMIWKAFVSIAHDGAESSTRRSFYLAPLSELTAAMFSTNASAFINCLRDTLDSAKANTASSLMIESLHGVKLAIFPTSRLNNSLDLLEAICPIFVSTKDHRLRESFGNALHGMLQPLVKVRMSRQFYFQIISAEVNLTRWKNLINILLGRTMSLFQKPKFKIAMIPALSTFLCLSNPEIFQTNWSEIAVGLLVASKNTLLDYQISHSAVQDMLWTVLNRWSDSISSTSSKLVLLVQVYCPQWSESNVPSEVLNDLLYRVMLELGPKQSLCLLRDIISPLLESSIIENRILSEAACITFKASLVIFGCYCANSGRIGEDNIDFEWSAVLDLIVSFRPSRILEPHFSRIKSILAKRLAYLDQFLRKSPICEVAQSEVVECFILLMELMSRIDLSISNESREALLLRYSVHPNDHLRDRISSLIVEYIDSPRFDPNVNRMCFTLCQAIPPLNDADRQVMTCAFRLLDALVRRLHGESFDQTFQASLVDVTIVGLLSQNDEVRNWALSVARQLCRKNIILEESKLDRLPELDRSPLNSILSLMNDIVPSHFDKACSTLKLIYGRFMTLNMTILGSANEDWLIRQWATYLSALLFWVPLSQASRRVISITRFDSLRKIGLLSPKPQGELDDFINVLEELFASVFAGSNEKLRSLFDECFECLNSKSVEAILRLLNPYLRTVSEDYRNIKYQFGVKSRRKEAVKSDLTIILTMILKSMQRVGSLEKALETWSHIVKRYTIECYYFCSEIDTKQIFPALRLQLAMLAKEYFELSLSYKDPEALFPFKLQLELFQTLLRWHQDLQLAEETQKGSMHRRQRHSRGSNHKGSTDQEWPSSQEDLADRKSIASTFSLGAFTESDASKSYVTCMASLCRNLFVPKNDHRIQMDLSLNQVLRWIDSLANASETFDGYKLAALAISNLLRGASDDLIQKIHQRIYQLAGCSMKASDCYYEALVDSVHNGAESIPLHALAALVLFKTKLNQQKNLFRGKELFEAESGQLAELSQLIASDLLSHIEPLSVERWDLMTQVWAIFDDLALRVIFVHPFPNATLNDFPELLASLLLISLKMELSDTKETSYCKQWLQIVALWSHHIDILVRFFIQAILSLGNSRTLMNIAVKVFQHISIKGGYEVKHTLVQVLTYLMTGPNSAVRVNLEPSTASNLILRIESLLQSTPYEYCPFTQPLQLLFVWYSAICSTMENCTMGPAVLHAALLLAEDQSEEVRASSSTIWSAVLPTYDPDCELANIVAEARMSDEYLSGWILNAMNWSVRCPLRYYSHRSAEILVELASLMTLNTARVVIVLISNYLHLLEGLLAQTTGPRDEWPIIEMIEVQLNVIEEMSGDCLKDSELQEHVSRIAERSLNEIRTPQLIRATCTIIDRLLDTALIVPDSLINSLNAALKVMHSSARAYLLELNLRILPKISKDSGTLIKCICMLLPLLLDALAKGRELGVPEKAALGSLCNSLEAEPSAAILVRVMQAYGRRKHRSIADAANELASAYGAKLIVENPDAVKNIFSMLSPADEDLIDPILHFVIAWAHQIPTTVETTELFPYIEGLITTLASAKSLEPTLQRRAILAVKKLFAS